MVLRRLAKAKVAGPIPVSRSTERTLEESRVLFRVKQDDDVPLASIGMYSHLKASHAYGGRFQAFSGKT